MDGYKISQEGQKKLQSCLKKYGVSSVQAVGLYLGKTKSFTSKFPAGSGVKTAAAPGIGVSAEKEERFLLSPNCFDFLCGSECTYGQALKSRIRELGTSAAAGNRTTVLAVIFPENKLWQGYDQELLKLLNGCFAENSRIVPVMVSTAGVDGAMQPVQKERLYVRMEDDWTVFSLVKAEGKLLRHTSVSLGSSLENQTLRLNDFVNNSTESWAQTRFPSWEKGFAWVCGELARNGWPRTEETRILCGEDVFASAGKCLRESGLAGSNISRIGDIAQIAAEYVYGEITRQAEPQKEQKKNTPEKKTDAPTGTTRSKPLPKMETPEDLFSW